MASIPVINSAQLGGIETSVLDNGPGRGVRIAWVNTGGGLRYKVVIDRGLDIADAEFMGQSLTWHSLGGITAPSRAYNRDHDWLRSFYGGLCVSCGPLNTGEPFYERNQGFGLHGSHSNTPASIESITNPNLSTGSSEMRISGFVRTAKVFGPNIELYRTISSRLGVPEINITDRFTNLHNQRTPLCWLLHINVGYPLLEPGKSTFCWRGKETPLEGMSEAWFSPDRDFKTAAPPREEHCGTGEYATYIDPEVDDNQNVVCGVVNHVRGIGLKLEFSLQDYRRLAVWQHWGPNGSYVSALEPTNAGVEGRPFDEKRGWVEYLDPGQSRTFHCKLSAINRSEDLDQLLALNRTTTSPKAWVAIAGDTGAKLTVD